MNNDGGVQVNLLGCNALAASSDDKEPDGWTYGRTGEWNPLS